MAKELSARYKICVVSVGIFVVKSVPGSAAILRKFRNAPRDGRGKLQAWRDQVFQNFHRMRNGVVRRFVLVLQKLHKAGEWESAMLISGLTAPRPSIFKLQVKRFYVVNHVKQRC